MKFVLIGFFLIFLIYLNVNNSSSIFHNRIWITTCQTCKNSLSVCIENKCNSIKQCKQCIKYENSECEICANQIFDDDSLEIINGINHFLCDPDDELQTLSCKIFCRGFHFSSGTCERINKIPICNCSDSTNLTSMTTTYKIPSTSKQQQLILELAGHKGNVRCMIVLENGDLVSGSDENSIKIWNLTNGTVKKKLEGHIGAVNSLALLTNGDLASGSFDKTIKIWNLDQDSIKRELIGHTGFIYSLALLANGDLASGSTDEIIIWNVDNGKAKRILEGHTHTVSSLVVLPNGDLVSGSWDSKFLIWNLNDGSIKRKISLNFQITSLLVLSKENHKLIIGGCNLIYIFDLNDDSNSYSLLGHTSCFNALVELENGDLASASSDNIKIWNLNDKTVKKTIDAQSGVQSLTLLKNGFLVSGGTSGNGKIKIWNLN